MTTLKKKQWLMAIKIALMLFSVLLIYGQVKSGEVKSGFRTLLDHLAQKTGTHHYIYIVVLLMPLNWIIETVKWKMLSSGFYPQTFLRSMRAVLSGVAISFFTPNRSGDFAGRILHLPANQRINGTVYSIAGSLAQLMITVTVGTISLLLLFNNLFDVSNVFRGFIYIILPLSVLGFHLFFFRLPIMGDWLSHVKFRVQWLDKLGSLKHIERILLVKVYTLSLLRYIIFTLQFYILLQIFGPNYSGWLPLALISTSFLFISLIPSFALGEIGIRGSVCIFLFTAMGYNGTDVLVTTTIIWFINIATPAVAGAVSMLYFKLEQ
jgi:hypothetical protein